MGGRQRELGAILLSYLHIIISVEASAHTGKEGHQTAGTVSSTAEKEDESERKQHHERKARAVVMQGYERAYTYIHTYTHLRTLMGKQASKHALKSRKAGSKCRNLIQSHLAP